MERILFFSGIIVSEGVHPLNLERKDLGLRQNPLLRGAKRKALSERTLSLRPISAEPFYFSFAKTKRRINRC